MDTPENKSHTIISGKNIIPEINVPDIMRNSFDRMSEPYSVVNCESRYIYANLALARLVGFNTPDGLIGKLYSEVQARIFDNEKSLNAWWEQDKQVINNPEKSLKMLEIHPEAAISPFTVEKIPLFEDNKVVGLIHHNRYVEVLKPNDFIRGRKPGSLLLTIPDNDFNEKECEIIFLKLQGITCRQMANMLNRSRRTIENRLQSIYDKMGVSNYEDFTHYCEGKNLDRYLPRRYLDPQRVIFG
ncbi:DNA-binding CsgD family transcriptional regulator [Erwinia toletana]|uniref:DNA-binding CsgD family transcriptional regulator n=1 Tax=Winslowiella toletana TaxID=92490 RepID=A0ABS4PFD1_9GAMM|nr:LuxR C-terminal-related transcriptional regulator [Winslowiella toletana]MBP2170786.1 DNA-binding CsgD family transcriptional regulator [Winslowiella toletana]